MKQRGEQTSLEAN